MKAWVSSSKDFIVNICLCGAVSMSGLYEKTYPPVIFFKTNV
jgi:hypothetical protein